MSGSGFDTIYGGGGSLISDSLSGHDLLVAEGGTESLSGSGSDTLVAGSGSTDMFFGTGTGASGIYEVNPGFGHTTIGTGSSSVDNLLFGSGLEPDDFTISLEQTGHTGNLSEDFSLVLTDGAASIVLPGGMIPGTIASVDFADTGPESLAQLVSQDGIGTTVVSGTDGAPLLFSTDSGEDLSASDTLQGVYAFGNDDTLYSMPETGPQVDAYGDDDTITGTRIWAGGSGDSITPFSEANVTLAGANDTVSGAYGGLFVNYNSSNVISVTPGSTGNEISSYVSYTLPQSVQTLGLYADSLTGTSNAAGGDLIANGDYDTLVGGAGTDTLNAAGTNDVLIGGSGAESYELADPSDSIQFGAGSASLNSVSVEFNYTLPGGADTLTQLANSADAVGNSGNDAIIADGNDDTLMAGGGADTLNASYFYAYVATLIGGSANDVFEVANSQDVVEESYSNTSDTLVSSASYTLPANVDTLILSGGGVLGAANSANDSMVAQSYLDTLVGSGQDTLAVSQSAGEDNVLVAGTGAEVLEDQSFSSNTFVFDSGFGQDTIAGEGSGDIIEFGAGISESSLTFTALPGSGGSAPSFVISGDGDAITVEGGLAPGAISSIQFSGGGSYTVQQLLAPSGDETIAGSGGNLILSSGNGDSITGGSGEDTVVAWGGNDTINAGAGGLLAYAAGADDIVDGSVGNDTLVADGAGDTLLGGSGSDGLVVNNADTVVEVPSGGGQDTLISSVTFSLPQYVSTMVLTGDGYLQATANDGNDLITANLGSDTLVDGGGADTFIGGPGDDQFDVSNSNDVIQVPYTNLRDTVISSATYSLPDNVDTLMLTGTADIIGTSNDGNDTIEADSSDNDPVSDGIVTLVGGSGADSLFAYYGNGGDVLKSGSGLDTLVAGEVQTLIINNSADVLDLDYDGEIPDDTVESSVSYRFSQGVADNVTSEGETYPAYIEWLLLGSANLDADAGLNDGDFTITGNSGQDTLIGGTGYNDIIAGSGIDTLIGGGAGAANLFVINNASDMIEALSTAGTNILDSSVSYTAPADVNTLDLTIGGLQGTGNGEHDTVTGSSDSLIGGSGNDFLLSQDDSTLVAGSGADTLSPAGDGDVLLLNSGFGDIQVLAAAEATQGPLVEFGSGIGSANLNASAIFDANGEAALAISDGAGTVTLDGALAGDPYRFEFAGGSALSLGQFLSQVNVTSSTVAGASGNLILDATPNTVLAGGMGNDTIYAAGTADTITGGSGNQMFVALADSDSIRGGSGSDTLSAYGDYDTVVSAAHGESDSLYGNYDALTTGSANSTVTASGDSDTIVSGSGASAAMAATAFGIDDSLVGGAGTDTLTASGTADTLMAGAGAQTLISEHGSTTFVVDYGADVIEEKSAGVSDTVFSSVSGTLPANIDTLLFTGSGNVIGTANGANDWLAGNAGADTLTAGAGLDTLVAGSGVDTLVGGTKADLFVINNSEDVVQVGSSHGADTIESSASYTLPSNVATLALTGTAALQATGNTLSDTLVANSGNDTLVAGSGTATLVGGTGNDTFVVDKTADVVQDTSASSSNTVESSVSYTLPTDVQYLTLTGTAALSGTGNGLDDLLVGNTGKDTLTGGTGIAVIEGGTAGSDLLRASSNQAALVGGGGSSTLTGGRVSGLLRGRKGLRQDHHRCDRQCGRDQYGRREPIRCSRSPGLPMCSPSGQGWTPSSSTLLRAATIWFSRTPRATRSPSRTGSRGVPIRISSRCRSWRPRAPRTTRTAAMRCATRRWKNSISRRW